MKMTKLLAVIVLLGVFITACSPVHDNQENNEQLGGSSTTGASTPSCGINSSLNISTPIIDATTAPTTNSLTRPDPSINIRGIEQYELLRAAATDDAALEKFLKLSYTRLLENREDVVRFLELLDSIPVFSVENATRLTVHYLPVKGEILIVYGLGEEKQAHWYRFAYYIDKDENAKLLENTIQQVGTHDFEKVSKDSNISFLQSRYANDGLNSFTRDNGKYNIEVNGMYVCVAYKNIYTDVYYQTPAEVFAPIRLEKTFDAAVTESFKSSSVK